MTTMLNYLIEANGQVKNQDGSPLSGTNVVIETSTTGTVSQQDGTFKLASPKNTGNLVFSFIGYKTKVMTF